MGETKTQLLESVNAVAGKLDAAAAELDGIRQMLTELAPATKPQQARLASGLTRFAATPIPCVTVGPTNGITTSRTAGNARNEGAPGWGAIRRLPSVQYQASYIGRDLCRHKAAGTFDAKLHAEGRLAAEKNYLDSCRMTGEPWKSPELRAEESRAAVLLLRTYGKDWIAQRPVKESTRKLYESLWNNHIEPTLGAVALRDLSAEAIRAWYAGLGADQPTRRKHAYSLLHSICKTAVNDQLLERNPCQIEGAMSTTRQREPEILSPAQLATVVAAMPDRLKALVLLSAWCGLRWGEVTEVRRKDFSDDCSIVTVSRGVTHKGQCRVGSTKSDKLRKALIPGAIRRAIKAHLDEHVEADRQTLLFVPAVVVTSMTTFR